MLAFLPRSWKAGRGSSILNLAALAILLGTPAAVPAATTVAPVSARTVGAAPELQTGRDAELRIAVSIEEGWHINSNDPEVGFLIPTTVELEAPDGVELVRVDYPEPSRRRLKLGGNRDLGLYEGEVEFGLVLRRLNDEVDPGPVVAFLRYQSCNDTLCLRPASLRIPVDVRVVGEQASAPLVHAGFNEEAADSIGRMVSGGMWVLVPGMILLGLGLNLTPCVYPLISITVAFFGHQAGGSRARKVWLAVSYTLGIAITFSVVGASAALSGGIFGAALTKPPVLIGLALLMTALALSSFGLYEIRLPDALNTRLGGSGTGTLGALFMGMTMGLVAAPCVGPVVIGLLVYVGTQGDVLLGLGLFFLLAVGLGIPYLVLAVAAGSISTLPRSGAWLEWVKHFFGCVLLAMAIYFLNPILPDSVEGVLMPSFLALAVAYLAFFDRAGREFRVFVFGRRLAGTVALAAIGFTNLQVAETHQELPFEPYTAARFETARANGVPLVVEFSAEWCLPCKEMEERTFTDSAVVKAGSGFVFLSVDMTTTDPVTEGLMEQFDVFGAPTTIFYAADGTELTRRVGFIGPVDFAKLLDQTRRPENSDKSAEGQGA